MIIQFFKGKNHAFQGDILVGPFIPYGVKSDDVSFFEKVNREYKNKSQDLTFKTLESFLSILSSYKNSKIKINFLPLDTSENLWKKGKFIEKFDFLHVSNFIGHQLTPELMKLMKKDAVVVIERSK